MASCLLCAITALAIGLAAGLRCRVFVLLPLAGAIACLSVIGWMASLAAPVAPCAFALIALQAGFLLGAGLGGRRAASAG